MWKDINGFEGKYQISEDGQVRSMDRIVQNKGGTMTVNARTIEGLVARALMRGNKVVINADW